MRVATGDLSRRLPSCDSVLAPLRRGEELAWLFRTVVLLVLFVLLFARVLLLLLLLLVVLFVLLFARVLLLLVLLVVLFVLLLAFELLVLLVLSLLSSSSLLLVPRAGPTRWFARDEPPRARWRSRLWVSQRE